jgi:hypothetical protein
MFPLNSAERPQHDLTGTMDSADERQDDGTSRAGPGLINGTGGRQKGPIG